MIARRVLERGARDVQAAGAAAAALVPPALRKQGSASARACREATAAALGSCTGTTAGVAAASSLKVQCTGSAGHSMGPGSSLRSTASPGEAEPAAARSPTLWGTVTPAGSATQAPFTPATAALGAADGAASAASAAAAAAAAPADSAAAAAKRAASAAAQWRRAQAFMECVAASPIIHSALLSLELAEGTHPEGAPMPPSAQALHWTLAQLLALHLKAGHARVTVEGVLASLWVLEAVQCSGRSPATVCLNDYLKHLAAFSTEAVLEITADWRNSFCRLRQAVVDAQIDLLKRLDWRVRLDAATEVQPCLDLLFGPVGRSAYPALATRSRELWTAHMNRVTANVQRQAALLQKQARMACRTRDECEESQQGSCKRRRMMP